MRSPPATWIIRPPSRLLDGTAQVSGPGVSLTIGANQTASITGTQSFSGTVGAARQDAFLTAMLGA